MYNVITRVSQLHKLARPLCAVMRGVVILLCLSLCLGGAGLTPVRATETLNVVSPLAQERYASYRYVVNVEFGSMSFYYDWGRWNVDEIAYVADSTSSSPSALTDDGAPGWYGFDGTTNRIALNYRRVGNEAGTEYLRVSMHFDFATNDAGTPVFANEQIAFSLYDTADFGGYVTGMNAQNAYTAGLVIAPSVDDVSTPTVDESEIMQDYYLSVDGAPYWSDMTRYENGTPTSLGLLTIRIDFTSDAP